MCHSTSACRPARARSARNAREYLAAPCCASSAVSWTLVVCPHVRDERGSVDVENKAVACEIGAVARPSGRIGFERALSHHVQVRNARWPSRLQRREEILQNQLQKNRPCRESQGKGCKRPERDLVRGCQFAPAAQARRPLRERLPPSMRRSNEPAALQGKGFTRLRSPV